MEVIDIITAPWQFTFFANAVIAGIVVSVTGAVIGSFIIVRGWGLVADAVAHAILPGVAIAAMNRVNILLGALPVALVFALTSFYIRKYFRVPYEVVLGLMFAGMFAIGLLILSSLEGLNFSVEDLLLGHIFSITRNDLIITASLAAALITIMAIFYRRFLLISVDPLFANISKINTKFYEALLISLVAVGVVIMLEATGIILMLTFIFAPVATANFFAKRLSHTIYIAILISVINILIGLYLSFYYDLLATPTIALMLVSEFFIGWIIKGRKTKVLFEQQ